MKKFIALIIVLAFLGFVGWQVYQKVSASVKPTRGRMRRSMPVAVEVEPVKKTLVRDNISRQIFSCDIHVAGTNAVTIDGKLVNIDAVGNRVGSMFFGPKRVFIVVGKNKIVKNIDEALYRIKNLIAPFHALTYCFKKVSISDFTFSCCPIKR